MNKIEKMNLIIKVCIKENELLVAISEKENILFGINDFYQKIDKINKIMKNDTIVLQSYNEFIKYVPVKIIKQKKDKQKEDLFCNILFDDFLMSNPVFV